MSRKVLGKDEVSEGQKLRTLNIILLLQVIASTIIGVNYTIGTPWVVLPVIMGSGAIVIVIANIMVLYKK